LAESKEKDRMEPSQTVNENKLYLGNLPFSMLEDDIRTLCAEFGEIKEIKLITDYATGRSKGFAFVEFATKEAADAAIAALDQKEIDGRAIFVKVAKPKAPRDDNRSFRGGSSRGGDRRGGFDRGNQRY